jgi:hypothetical protein
MILKAKYAFTGSLDGERISIGIGDLFDSNHPAVRKWPDFFIPAVIRTGPKEVEQATAAPGEKRGSR